MKYKIYSRLDNGMRKDIDKVKNVGKLINENMGNDLDEVIKLKQIHDDLVKHSVSQDKISQELMRHSTGGYEIGEYGYPIVFFVGEYCLVLGSGIYKLVR